jgi:hypothetical protein
MGLSAWEQAALDSIKSGIAGSDPELAALMSAFTRLASDDEMPRLESVPPGLWRGAQARLHGRRRSSLRKTRQRTGFRQAPLLWLWALTTAALITVALVLSAGDHGGSCTETMAMTCVAPGNSPASSPRGTTADQTPRQPAGIPQAGP